MFWSDLQGKKKKKFGSRTDRVGPQMTNFGQNAKEIYFLPQGYLFFQTTFSITRMAVVYINKVRSVIPLIKKIHSKSGQILVFFSTLN